MERWSELWAGRAGLWPRLRDKVPISAPIALGSAALYGLGALAPSFLAGLLLVLFALSALLAAGIGLIETVAQEERSRLLAFAAAAYGVIAVIFTLAHAISGVFGHSPTGPR